MIECLLDQGALKAASLIGFGAADSFYASAEAVCGPWLSKVRSFPPSTNTETIFALERKKTAAVRWPSRRSYRTIRAGFP